MTYAFRRGCAVHDGDRAFHHFENLEDADVFRPARQGITAVRAADGFHESRLPQFDDQTADVFFGNLLIVRDFPDHARLVPDTVQRDIQKNPQTVTPFRGNFHELPLSGCRFPNAAAVNIHYRQGSFKRRAFLFILFLFYRLKTGKNKKVKNKKSK